MIPLQQILADQGKRQIFRGPPPQADIHREIAANGDADQVVHVTRPDIQLEIIRKIHDGSQAEPPFGLGADQLRIHVVGRVHFHRRIREVQLPPVQW